MKEIITKFNKKSKITISIVDAILFIVFILCIIKASISYNSTYFWIGFIIGLCSFLLSTLLFDFSKINVLRSDGIYIYKHNKLKKTYKYSDIKRGYTTYFMFEKFLILDDSKKGLLIPLSSLDKEELHDIRKIFKINSIEIKDKRGDLYNG